MTWTMYFSALVANTRPNPKNQNQAGSLSKKFKNEDVGAHENHWEVSSDDGRHAHLSVGPIHCAVEELQVCHSQFPAKKLRTGK